MRKEMGKMSDRNSDDRPRERYEDEQDFRRRAGALDRRWGYGDVRELRGGQEEEHADDYNAPGYWQYQREWMQPGPFTGRGPKNYRRRDEAILEEICERLTQHAQIDGREIQVEVEEGEVTLKGEVQDRRMKRMVEANVDRITGVIDVHNRLRVRHQQEREQMDNPFPGGPTPTGPAGYDEEGR
jgi:hypothetical protein